MALAADFDPDEPVIEAIRSGDHYAFSELMRRHGRWVRGVIFGVLGDSDRVDDVAQQVWTAVWRRAGELRDTRRWRPWLYRLARNAAVDAGRKITRRRSRTQQLTEVPVGASTTAPVGELVGDEQHREVLRAIQALPALYREPFVLRHLQGWTYKEIAEVMDMRVDSVETRLVRARRFLREALKDKIG
ncbi:MAG: RNA polymerase sigma factor [Planctomycetota bacterium]